jgi:hypothetical protein
MSDDRRTFDSNWYLSFWEIDLSITLIAFFPKRAFGYMRYIRTFIMVNKCWHLAERSPSSPTSPQSYASPSLAYSKRQERLVHLSC